MKPWNLLPRKGISHFGWVYEHKFCKFSKTKKVLVPIHVHFGRLSSSYGQAKDKTPLLYLQLKLNIMPS
jgi:hypothetical protein